MRWPPASERQPRNAGKWPTRALAANRCAGRGGPEAALAQRSHRDVTRPRRPRPRSRGRPAPRLTALCWQLGQLRSLWELNCSSKSTVSKLIIFLLTFFLPKLMIYAKNERAALHRRHVDGGPVCRPPRWRDGQSRSGFLGPRLPRPGRLHADRRPTCRTRKLPLRAAFQVSAPCQSEPGTKRLGGLAPTRPELRRGPRLPRPAQAAFCVACFASGDAGARHAAGNRAARSSRPGPGTAAIPPAARLPAAVSPAALLIRSACGRHAPGAQVLSPRVKHTRALPKAL